MVHHCHLLPFNSKHLLINVIDSFIFGWHKQTCNELGESIVMIISIVYMAGQQYPQKTIQTSWFLVVQLVEYSDTAMVSVTQAWLPATGADCSFHQCMQQRAIISNMTCTIIG